MSRCVLDNEATDTEVVIGWDPGGETFFARIFDHKKARRDAPSGNEDEYEEAGLVLWITGVGERFSRPDPVIEMVKPFAPPFDTEVLQRELLKDQAADEGDRTYSVEGSEVFDF